MNEYSSSDESSTECCDNFSLPSGRRPMSSGCRLTKIIDIGHTNIIPKTPKTNQADSHE